MKPFKLSDYLLIVVCVIFIALASVGRAYGQKLPEMVIDPNVFVNSMEVDSYTYDIRDTASLCYYDGHFICDVVNNGTACKTQRIIKYTTMLWNDGDTVAYYGNPETDTVNWIHDDCEPHHHMHLRKGIEVLLEHYDPTTQIWYVVSKNNKLSYDMVNQTKYPAEWDSHFLGYDSLWNPIITHTLRIDSRVNLSWYTSFTPIDSEKAKMRSEPASGGADPFYTYPDVSYNSGNRGILQGWGDEYGKGYAGNFNHLFNSGDGFYRIKAWHDAPFPQRQLFPDTVKHSFYLLGNSIIHDTLPPAPTCNTSNPAPTTVVAEEIRNRFTGNVRCDSTGACEYVFTRILVTGNTQQASAVFRSSVNYIADNTGIVGRTYIYDVNGTRSEKVKYRN